MKGDPLLPQLKIINYLSSVHTTCMPRDCLIDFLHFFFPYSLGEKKSYSTWNIGIEFVFTTAVLCDQVLLVLSLLDYNRSYR